MNKQVLHNAIVHIKRGIEIAAKAMDEKAVEELTVTLEALEKQVRKKPISAGEEYSTYYCPCCRKHMIINQFNYCPDCGQAIDWRDEDE